MQEKEWIIEGGSLVYEINKNRVEITQLKGMASTVKVPERIEELPVCIIRKKAFLSKKNLRKIYLPETIDEIGDWAFAYCDNLQEVWMPKKKIGFGRAIFMECGKLIRLWICHRNTGKNGADRDWDKKSACLLSAAVTAMDAYYLLDPEETGSSEWLNKWDARLVDVIDKPDTEGYSHQVLCGEEDYGSTDLAAFVAESRKRKVRLAFLRLLCPMGLNMILENRLKAYLKQHTKDCESEEAWEVLWKEHGEHREYYELFVRIGGLTEENVTKALADVGENTPEMKAYFIRNLQKQENFDFFDELSL